NSISIECLSRLADNGILAGIKDSTANTERMTELVNRFGNKLTVMAASDSFATEGRKLGAHGFISALANVWPGSFAKLWSGDASLQPAVDSVRKAVKDAGGIPGLKYLATLRGYPMGASRLPFTDLSPEQKLGLEAALAGATSAGLQ